MPATLTIKQVPDEIVAGSRWGEAPPLPRDQANDRTLTREFEHLAQERQAGYRR